jgi:predicted metalloprotease
VLADTETTWKQLLGPRYEEPRLVLFTGAVRSACGTTSSAVGPFYCPGDHKVYLDLGFFTEMAQRLGAPGDFAQAYVIAHEVGHHVQNLTGIAEKVARLQQNCKPTATPAYGDIMPTANAISSSRVISRKG